MAQLVLWERAEDGRAAVFWPAAHAYDTWTMEEIASAVVPHGTPYWIIDEADVPADRSERNAWGIAEGLTPHGYGGESDFPPEKEPESPADPEQEAA